jgi:hypothetical protein
MKSVVLLCCNSAGPQTKTPNLVKTLFGWTDGRAKAG